MVDKLIDFIISPKVYLPIVYIVFGLVSYKVIKEVIKHLFGRKKIAKAKDRKRYRTLMQVAIDIVKVVIVTLVLLSILTVYGFDVTSALAGLGIVSLVLGLASQDLIKDIISGSSIIMEDYFSVGDVIEISGFKGEVVHIGVKTTKIKKWDGPVMMIANRNITSVINHSANHSIAIVDFSIAYEEDVEKAIKVIEGTFDKLREDARIVGDIEVLGVESLGDSRVVIRVIATTVAQEHYGVQRLMRQKFKDALENAKIKIPYPQLEVHNAK